MLCRGERFITKLSSPRNWRGRCQQRGRGERSTKGAGPPPGRSHNLKDLPRWLLLMGNFEKNQSREKKCACRRRTPGSRVKFCKRFSRSRGSGVRLSPGANGGKSLWRDQRGKTTLKGPFHLTDTGSPRLGKPKGILGGNLRPFFKPREICLGATR